MSKKYLVQTTRSIILLLAVLGLAFFGAAVPVGGSQLLENAPELSYCYLPWIVFIEMMVVPCYAVLVRTWEIITSLLYDRMFTAANARNFQRISIITFTTTVYFFFGNTALFFLNMSHPLIYLISFAFIGIGVGVALAAAILSYRAGQISNIQEQSKLSVKRTPPTHNREPRTPVYTENKRTGFITLSFSLFVKALNNQQK